MEKMSSFEELLSKCPNLIKALQESLQITTPTPIQSAALPVLLSDDADGFDVVMQAQTGSGKTLAFLLPLLQRMLLEHPSGDREAVGTLALVIVPTRELAAQTLNTATKVLSRIRPHWIVSTTLTGGADSRKSEKARLRRGCQLVIGTPGRVLDHLKTSQGWRRSDLRWIVIDEADRLADMGFENTIREIFSIIRNPAVRVILLSATVTEKLKTEFAGRPLKRPQFIKAAKYGKIKKLTVDEAGSDSVTQEPPSLDESSSASFTAPEAIDQGYLHVPTRLRLMVLTGLLRSFFPITSSNTRVIVFFSCCDSVDFHYNLFQKSSENKGMPALLPPRIKVLKLHGNLEQSLRISTFNEFVREGKKAGDASTATVLFCTDVAARGLDFPNLAGSIQYDAPCDIHDYIHRAGRTGRMNPASGAAIQTSRSLLFLMPSEEAYIGRLQGMGMKALHRVSFDEYLKWIEKLDAKKLQGLLTKKKNRNFKGKHPIPSSTDISTVAPEESLEDLKLPHSVKGRINQLQLVFETAVAADASLSAEARDAFLSTVRAYATHPASEKEIFHPKRLHLGHLAAAFGLDREPKRLLDGVSKKNRRQDDHEDIPEEFKSKKHSHSLKMKNSNFSQNEKEYNNRLSFRFESKSSSSASKKSRVEEEFVADDDTPLPY